MTTTVAVLIICAVLVIIDVIPLYQGQQWLSFFVYIGFLIAALGLSVWLDFSVEIYSPSDLFKKIVTLIWGIKQD